MPIIEKMKSNQNIQIQQLNRARHIFLSVLQFKVSDYSHLVSSSYSLNEGIIMFTMIFIEITTNRCNRHIDEASYQFNI